METNRKQLREIAVQFAYECRDKGIYGEFLFEKWFKEKYQFISPFYKEPEKGKFHNEGSIDNNERVFKKGCFNCNFSNSKDIIPLICTSCEVGTFPNWESKDEMKENSAVNHPSHYGGENNPYEAIKVIEAWELDFNLGNTVKYIARAGKKDATIQELEKAKWYLEREINNLKEK